MSHLVPHFEQPRRSRSRASAATALVLVVLAASALEAQQLSTASEASGFERHTTHPEMMDYLLQLRASSTDMRLGTYGETREGRELPYVIFSRPLVSQPWEAALLERPVVLLAANVHGGERTLRESLLILMRSLATRGTPENALLDDLVILAAPQINPDGFHTGPNGQRGNAWGIDLNRDYVKLEHPEIASYVGSLVSRWHPHLFVDGHNGGSFPYNINYQCPSHAAPDQRITDLCDEEIFPFINRAIAVEGFKGWYYQRGTETRWNTGGFEARIGRNYGGFTNTFGILFESPGDQDLRTGVRAGYLSYKAVLEYVQQNPVKIVDRVRRARLETLTMGLGAQGEVVVQMRYDPEDRTVQYEIARGQGDDRQIVQVTSDSLMKKPVPLLTRARPYAYLLSRDAVDAVAMLRRHDVTVEWLEQPVELPVQVYSIAGIEYSEQYNHTAAASVRVDEVLTRTMSFPRGTYVVPTGQVLGRLVTHMLEPETEDNVVYWNTMDAWLPRPGGGSGALRDPGPPLVPIYKVMSPTALPTRILR